MRLKRLKIRLKVKSALLSDKTTPLNHILNNDNDPNHTDDDFDLIFYNEEDLSDDPNYTLNPGNEVETNPTTTTAIPPTPQSEANAESIPDPSRETTRESTIQLLSIIFFNLFYTFIDCTQEIHARQKAETAKIDPPPKPFHVFLAQIRKEIPLPNLLHHSWI